MLCYQKKMGHHTDVLVFGTMGNIGQEVERLLAGHGIRTASVPFPQNIFRDESGYRRTLVRAISEFRPEVVFPAGNPLAMARFKGLIEQGVPLGTILNRRQTDPLTEEAVRNIRIAVEKEETIRLLDSKVRCYALANLLGIPQPRVFGSPDEIPEGTKTVFKRDVSFGGHGVHLPKDLGALQRLIAHQSPGEPFLIEEFIEGQDYSLDAVRGRDGGIVSGGYRCLSTEDFRKADGGSGAALGRMHKQIKASDSSTSRLQSRAETVSVSHTTDNGRTVSSCLAEKAKSIYEGFGPAVVREALSEGDSVLEEMRACAANILGHLDYHGICGFDFRADASGNIWLLECNPRFTGGICVQASAGLNLPIALYRTL